jgi:hypothetical protein
MQQRHGQLQMLGIQTLQAQAAVAPLAAPNPTTGILTLEGPMIGQAQFQLMDAVGGLYNIAPSVQGEHAVQIDLTHLAAGIYSLRTTLAGKQHSQKILLQH